MKSLLRLLLKSQHQRNRSGPAQTDKGMTLVELLVGAIMAFLIITPMIGFVVDMLNTDRREQVKSNTEQDIQAAVDFIAQDLSQAIYIYDRKGITAIQPQLPANNDPTKIPILVFWKRQQIKNSVPINSDIKPNECSQKEKAGQCNDTYVLSLVAYYQFKDTEATWCQPSGGTAGNCPTRIARYEIRDGIRKPDPVAADTNLPYYNEDETDDTQERDPAFNKAFDFSKPTENVTLKDKLGEDKSGGKNKNAQVLVNYIDHSTPDPSLLSPPECKTALGNPTDPKDPTTSLDDGTLKVSDGETNSFYACVDTARNIARVTIRGNSLRRLETPANYDPKKAAYFPTATVQVQGLGAVGK